MTPEQLERFAMRVQIGTTMLAGLALGAIIGDLSQALASGVAGLALSVIIDIARVWARDAWPTVKRWWSR